MAVDVTRTKDGFNRRLDEIGWALFLIMIGAIWLFPDSVPQDAWLIGAGVIMLGVNAIRYLNGIAVNAFTAALGVVALAAGIAGVSGVKISVFAIILIVVGLGIIARPMIANRTKS
ncbi:MAG TPA: hypothetical protein VMA36_06610 [Candidatus Limnocylindria bacterium]|jgi:hypothetical protein|nr:hypothetical protein [Candidatus Limnocylindria bacterium]